MLLFLDNAESILDPQGTYAQEIHSVVEELSRFPNICLGITSRISTVPPHCKCQKIPPLSMEAACDVFYTIYDNGGRSGIIDDLVRRLDFHALSITLLATTASHNLWSYDRVAKKWDTQRAKILRANYNQSLAATIELSLASPTFHGLDPIARELLGIVAFFPQGINEDNLDWLFPTIVDKEDIFDQFCVLSLASRGNGFITMLAPIREYLKPQDPQSSPLLCAVRDSYFSRLPTGACPRAPGFGQAQWVLLEDVNVEYLLDVFISVNTTSGDIWDACLQFIEYLVWHKPRLTILGQKIENLPDGHPSKPECLVRLSLIFQSVGNPAKQKRLLTHALQLAREQGNKTRIAETLAGLSNANRILGIYKEGIEQVKESLEIFEGLGDTKGQVNSLICLAWLLRDNEQLDAAEDAALRAIDLVSEGGKGSRSDTCQSHRILGEIYLSKGEKERAIPQFETVLRIASHCKWRSELSGVHHSLASLFFHERDFDKACVHIEQAKSYAAGDPYHLGQAMMVQAAIWHNQHKLEDATSEALKALQILEELGVVEGCHRGTPETSSMSSEGGSSGGCSENNPPLYAY